MTKQIMVSRYSLALKTIRAVEGRAYLVVEAFRVARGDPLAYALHDPVEVIADALGQLASFGPIDPSLQVPLGLVRR